MNEVEVEREPTIPVPEPLPVGPDGKVHLSGGRAPEPLTAEQLERIRLTKEHRERAEREWKALTPEERALEEEGWEWVMREINDARRGYRPVFVDP